MSPVFYHRPDGPVITLRTAPRLSNWNRSGDTGGARLTRALGYSQAAIDPALAACTGPIALRFDVGLPRTTRLFEERDLDQYLLPLTADLARQTQQPVVSVWGCKRYSESTTLRIEAAHARDQGDHDPDAVTIGLTVSGDRDAFKAELRQQVRDAVTDRQQLDDGPVVLELAFTVGPQRNWLDLWWSTIDGLGPLLGQSPFQPDFHPRDGRITDLGLHCTTDPEAGDEVTIAIRAHAGWLDPEPVQ